MPSEITLDTLYREIKQLKTELRKKDSGHWVKGTVITELTGWDANQMRAARNNGALVWKKTPEGILYDLNKLNHVFIIKKTA